MAGFVDNNDPSQSPVIQRIRESVRKLSTFGMKYDDMVIRNSQAVGVTEAAFLNKNKANVEDESMLWTLAKQDITTRQFISYFDKDYKSKRDYLRKFSLNPEIEWVLDTICDEAISYDPANFFAYPDFIDITNINEKLKDDLYENYKNLYDIWGFTDDITGWQYFRQFLVDGFLCFEIIYDNDGKYIVGFKELDSVTIVPSVEKQIDGSFINTWTQFPQDPKRRRVLYDPQVIYISYAKGNSISRVSYIERLIRPYNILRIIEYTRIIWSVMNSSFRLKMTVPIGTKSPQKGMQTLGELMSIYKEDIQLNDDSGELLVDGKPKIQFYKNYLMPSGVNGTPTIEPVNTEGPNLNDPAPLSYFFDKFVQESKVPPSRFHTPDGGNTSPYSNGAEGMDKEEIRFSKFVERLRSIFQEILTKPLWIQMAKKYAHLEKDFMFKSQLGLDYFSDNPFKINQEMDVINKRKESVTTMSSLTGDEEKPYFSNAFLIETFLGMSRQDIIANREAIERKEKEKKKAEKKEGGEEKKEGEEGETPEVTL
ncbi:MAG: hypothetical protein EBZ95_06750 [Chitinophagia bacterium]|nr:hypothetical protein [Chitinophagia bacterium]